MKTKTTKYVDGFVIPIKKKDISAYRKMAEWGAKTWKKYGALEYFECVGDDLKVHMGAGLGFAKLAKLKADETVVFSWIVYKSKAHRNQVNKKVMRDPDMNNFDTSTMPFDMRRFATGGFKVILEG
jgi:alkaline phosphatase